MKFNKTLFTEDYFSARNIRHNLVRLYKNCYRYCSQMNIPHKFDQYGYIKSENRFVTIDELEEEFASKVKDVQKLILNIRTIYAEIELKRKGGDVKITYPEDLINAMYPHVHWAYHCAKNDMNPEQRKKYYTAQPIKMTSTNYRRFIEVEYPKVYHRKWDGGEYQIKKAEELLKHYGETNLIQDGDKTKKKIVFFTGSGISKESGIPTFRDSDGLWEQYPVDMVASTKGWYSDPTFVNEFYNKLREKYTKLDSNGIPTIVPNGAHKYISRLSVMTPKIENGLRDWSDESNYNVVVVTQNVDNLHEQADKIISEETGKDIHTDIVHLHGELLKMCIDGYKEDERYHVQLPYNGSLTLSPTTKVKDIFTPINRTDCETVTTIINKWYNEILIGVDENGEDIIQKEWYIDINKNLAHVHIGNFQDIEVTINDYTFNPTLIDSKIVINESGTDVKMCHINDKVNDSDTIIFRENDKIVIKEDSATIYITEDNTIINEHGQTINDGDIIPGKQDSTNKFIKGIIYLMRELSPDKILLNKFGTVVEEDIEYWDKIKNQRMRPYIVFFGEDVPNIGRAIHEAQTCDIFVVIGTSLQVYPAAELINYVPYGSPIYLIDPNISKLDDFYSDVEIIQKSASEGMKDLIFNHLTK